MLPACYTSVCVVQSLRCICSLSLSAPESAETQLLPRKCHGVLWAPCPKLHPSINIRYPRVFWSWVSPKQEPACFWVFWSLRRVCEKLRGSCLSCVDQRDTILHYRPVGLLVVASCVPFVVAPVPAHSNACASSLLTKALGIYTLLLEREYESPLPSGEYTQFNWRDTSQQHPSLP